MNKQRCLMLGAGHRKPERIVKALTSAPEDETEWVTLDNNPDSHPDILFDLNRIERTGFWSRLLRRNRLPFPDNHFDEIHAYEVLEHYGHQGDYEGFFAGMREFWRILKPRGILFGTCPLYNSVWAWGDPSHTRIIGGQTLVWLSRDHYLRQSSTPASDFRRLVDPCWWIVDWEDGVEKDSHCQFGLVKESGRRVAWKKVIGK